MAKVTYPTDATLRTDATLESLGMEFMGYDSVTKAALRTTYASIKSAILGGGGLPSRIEDADQDTSVETEKTADDDTIRFTTKAIERGIMTDGGEFQWNSAVNLLGGVSGVGPAPQLTFGSYLDNAGNASISHLSLYGTTYGLGISSGAGNSLDIISGGHVSLYRDTDLANFKARLTDAGNLMARGKVHVGADDTQAIYIPDQTNFLGTTVFGDGGGSLSHVSGFDGQFNFLGGVGAGAALTTGFANMNLGYRAGNALSVGFHNVCLGYQAGLALQDGEQNLLLGASAGGGFVSSIRNCIIGYGAGIHASLGHYNTFLGYKTGESNQGAANVFLGYRAGGNETGSNKLYIENSNSVSPLIYGEFDNDIVKVNGDLQTSLRVTIDQVGSDPTAVASKGILFVKDVTGTTQLFFRRSNGTTVQLT